MAVCSPELESRPLFIGMVVLGYILVLGLVIGINVWMLMCVMMAKNARSFDHKHRIIVHWILRVFVVATVVLTSMTGATTYGVFDDLVYYCAFVPVDVVPTNITAVQNGCRQTGCQCLSSLSDLPVTPDILNISSILNCTTVIQNRTETVCQQSMCCYSIDGVCLHQEQGLCSVECDNSWTVQTDLLLFFPENDYPSFSDSIENTCSSSMPCGSYTKIGKLYKTDAYAKSGGGYELGDQPDLFSFRTIQWAAGGGITWGIFVLLTLLTPLIAYYCK